MEFRFCDEQGSAVPAEGTPGRDVGALRRHYQQGMWQAPTDESLCLRTAGWRQATLAISMKKGLLHICGRAKDMVLRGGENIYPSEVEAMLLEHPDCEEAAVVALPDATPWGEVPGGRHSNRP